MTKKYSAEEIKKLGDMAAIRGNPGMYIGDKRQFGLNHILWEVVSNAIDEATAGYGAHIRVQLNADGSAEVADEGRGIPVDWKADEHAPAMSLVFLKLHSGGKHADSNSAYGRSGGMHGVGGKAANAMSLWLVVEVRRHGLLFRQRFHNGGLPETGVDILDGTGAKVAEVRADTLIERDANDQATRILVGGRPVRFTRFDKPKTGTRVVFLPNREFFDHKEMDWKQPAAVPWDLDGVRGLRNRFRQTAYLIPGVTIEFTDARTLPAAPEVFHSDDGLLGYVHWLNDGHEALHKPIYFQTDTAMDVGDKKSSVVTEVAMQYAGEDTHIVSFVNTIPTPNGGKHVSALQAALTKAIKSFADDKKLLKAGEDVRPDDLNLGLTAVVNITMGHTPQFQGQTKDALNSPEVYGPVFSACYEFLSAYLNKNIPVGKVIVRQAQAAAHGRQAAALARQQIISRGGGLDDPGAALTIKKLADIQRRGGEPVVPKQGTALFLVEGDSAGGAAKQGREAEYHGILALRGKIDNVWGKKLADILKSPEITTILRAIGGVSDDGSSFDVSTMRYGRVTIMSDADVDGEHIRVLLLTMFWTLRPDLIRAGRVFIARPPLYKVVPKKGEPVYCYSDSERDEAIRKLGGMERLEKVQRYKGLGEMNADELHETIFQLPREARNGKTSDLALEDYAFREIKVTADDAEAITRTLELLMGSAVEPRKEWLMKTWEVETVGG